MYPEERKTPAGAGDGRDMVAPNPERSCLICVRKQKWKPKSVRERWDIFELTEIMFGKLSQRLQISRSERHGEIADKRSAVWLVVQGVQGCWCAWPGTFSLTVLAGCCKDKH